MLSTTMASSVTPVWYSSDESILKAALVRRIPDRCDRWCHGRGKHDGPKGKTDTRWLFQYQSDYTGGYGSGGGSAEKEAHDFIKQVRSKTIKYGRKKELDRVISVKLFFWDHRNVILWSQKALRAGCTFSGLFLSCLQQILYQEMKMIQLLTIYVSGIFHDIF